MYKQKLQIPLIEAKKDLRIIYKEGECKIHEIFTSKDDFLKSLRYFQPKIHEINQTNLVFIQENISLEIFEGFISSISTREVEIDDNNYKDYYFLSDKYKYTELYDQICTFIKERPDIISVIDDLSKLTTNLNAETDNSNNNSNYTINELLSYEKEELIAKNLDIAIQNGNLNNLPLSILNRILHSPKIVIKDYHLLCSFVINLIKQKSKEKLNHEDQQNLLILPSSLDYLKMSNSEIQGLFLAESDNLKMFINPQNSEEQIKKFISIENELQNQSKSFDEKLKRIESEFKSQLQIIQDNQSSFQKSISEKLNKQSETTDRRIKEIQKEIENKQNSLEKKVREHESKLKSLEMNAKSIEENKIKELQSELQNLKQKQQEIRQNLDIRCPNGIFHYLFDQYKGNPVDEGLVEIIGNSYDSSFVPNLPKIIDANWTGGWWLSKEVENSFIKINFKRHLVKITKYHLLVGINDGVNYFNSWILTGTTKNDQNFVLSEVNNLSEITHNHPETTLTVQNNNYYFKSIQLTMRGKTSCGSLYIVLRNIEIFGSIKILS